MAPGQLALVLHAHLPFVRHPEHDDFLEECWLFEAVVETYLPLLEIFDRLERDGIPFALTMTLTPTLCAMLVDPLLQARTQRYLDRVVELAEAEIGRTAIEQEAYRLLGRRDLSVTAVAMELGYSDPAHFTRAFGRWTGQSPRNWRQTIVAD